MDTRLTVAADWRALAAQPAAGSPKTSLEHKRRVNSGHSPPQLVRRAFALPALVAAFTSLRCPVFTS